jgi:FemAB-related protein (PEP-CTERM system-associated)
MTAALDQGTEFRQDAVSPSMAPLTVTALLEPSSWDRYVEACPAASGYHLSGWRSIFEGVFGHRTLYLAALRGQQVAGVLPLVEFRSPLFGRFAVSLPFVNQGGVLANDPDASRALLKQAVVEARDRGLTHLELRHEQRQFPDLPDKQHKVSMRLALPHSADALWDQLDRKARNQVRKAEKSGLIAATGGVECLDGFYSVFAENMRDLGTPVYPRRFFLAIMERFPERARVHHVSLDGDVIAASLTLTWRDTVEVPWASSLRSHRDKSPNNLLYWAMLRQAIAEGRRVFDFGRSTPDEGTYHFKAQWGATPGPMHWEYWLASGALPDLSPANPKFQAAIAAWRRLPLWVTNRVGPLVVRNIP